MALFPRFPRGEFGSLFRLLDDYDAHRADRTSGTTSVTSFAPKFDVRELKDAYELHGDLPGIDQKDVSIEFTDPHTIVVKGRVVREYSSDDDKQPSMEEEGAEGKEKEEKPAEGEQGAAKYWVSERSVGEFYRAFCFPTRVDQDKVKASLKNGVLAITVPKASAPATKRIAIES